MSIKKEFRKAKMSIKNYIKDYIYRFPNPISKRYNYCVLNENSKSILEALNKDGIFHFKGLLSKDKISETKEAFDTTIDIIEDINLDHSEKKITPLPHFGVHAEYVVDFHNADSAQT